jgi:hypothetical protein
MSDQSESEIATIVESLIGDINRCESALSARGFAELRREIFRKKDAMLHDGCASMEADMEVTRAVIDHMARRWPHLSSALAEGGFETRVFRDEATKRQRRRRGWRRRRPN